MLQSGKDVRLACRQGKYERLTGGMAPGHVQANLVILPSSWAYDFLLFAQRNPKPCPVLEVGSAGSPYTKYCADNGDVRTDLPKYNIYRNGVLKDQVNDIQHLWNDDLVYFLIGCSFTFETALQRAGLSIRHIEEKCNVPMYKTNILCHASGRFSASPLVVSMRPFSHADAIKAISITRDYPRAHGTPIHMGAPKEIGIADINTPDFGDAITILANEIPLFWACGVTPQVAALHSKPPLMITHAPGHMFVGDLSDEELRY